VPGLRLACIILLLGLIACSRSAPASTVEADGDDNVGHQPATTAWAEAAWQRLHFERAAALRSWSWPKNHTCRQRLEGPVSAAERPAAPIRSVLLIGASTMQWAVGRAIERQLTYAPVRVVNAARSATGLARPDHHDWMERSIQLVDEHKPDVVIVQFGGNDCQSLFDAEGEVVVNYDARQRWRSELFRRMGELVVTLREHGSRVVLLDLQPMESRNHHRCVSEMNDLTERAGVMWQVPVVSVQQLVGGPDGEYVESTRWMGRDVHLRAADGLHLTRAGGEIVAAAVFDALRQLRGWPDAVCETPVVNGKAAQTIVVLDP
jgi:hypothetical protein